MAAFKRFLKDNKGKPSMARLAVLIMITWFIADWMVCVQASAVYTLTANKMTLIMSVLSLKAVQKYSETKK